MRKFPLIREQNAYMDGSRSDSQLERPVWVNFRHRPRIEENCIIRKTAQGRLLRKKQEDHSHRSTLKTMIATKPEGTSELRYNFGEWTAIYKWGQWLPHTANLGQLPFRIEEREGRRPLLRSPDRKTGLADITRESHRIKSFRLRDAITYSYWRDLRFVLVLCALLGFSLWWFIAPELF